jgi:hypothetical protein
MMPGPQWLEAPGSSTGPAGALIARGVRRGVAERPDRRPPGPKRCLAQILWCWFIFAAYSSSLGQSIEPTGRASSLAQLLAAWRAAACTLFEAGHTLKIIIAAARAAAVVKPRLQQWSSPLRRPVKRAPWARARSGSCGARRAGGQAGSASATGAHAKVGTLIPGPGPGTGRITDCASISASAGAAAEHVACRRAAVAAHCGCCGSAGLQGRHSAAQPHQQGQG